MRHIGDIMKEMGFNKDTPLEIQKAFIKHLIKAARATESSHSSDKPKVLEKEPIKGEQLSFDLKVS